MREELSCLDLLVLETTSSQRAALVSLIRLEYPLSPSRRWSCMGRAGIGGGSCLLPLVMGNVSSAFSSLCTAFYSHRFLISVPQDNSEKGIVIISDLERGRKKKQNIQATYLRVYPIRIPLGCSG